MIESRPSVTAERVAMRRAAHQVLDEPPVFHDPLAVRITGLSADDLAREFETNARLNRQRRAFVAARSRFVEDELARAVGNGVDQYIVLGAGLDTFAYRNPYENVRVFEVDHPATQAWKRDRLTSTGIAMPSSLSFVAIDFERERLSDALSREGFDASRRTMFAWLGVVAYLTLDAVLETLGFVASCRAGTTIVFDYARSPDRLTAPQRAGFDVVAARLAAAGEPWRTFFEPADLAARLRAMHFSDVQDIDADILNARYFSNRKDDLRIDGIGRLAHLARASV